MAERLSTGLRNEMVGAGGQSMADALNDGILKIFTGAQPATADAAETGTLIAEITQDSGAFVSEAPENGLSFDVASAGAAPKNPAEVWSGVGINGGGVAGWFRFYGNTVITGSSPVAIRFDGNISTTGADMNMANTTIADAATTTIDDGAISIPAS